MYLDSSNAFLKFSILKLNGVFAILILTDVFGTVISLTVTSSISGTSTFSVSQLISFESPFCSVRLSLELFVGAVMPGLSLFLFPIFFH